MKSGMLGIEWAPCLLEPKPDRDLEAFARRELGIVPPDLAYLTPCSWLARAAVTFHQRLASRLDPHLADAIALVVSHENSCRFCYATVRALLRIQGMSETRVQELEARLDGGLNEPRMAAAIAFARQMARSAPLTDARDRERLEKAGTTAEEFREIAFVVAYMTFGNRVTTIPAIPPFSLEQGPSSWRFPFTRPFVARALGAFLRGDVKPEPPTKPLHFARLIAVYDGSPIASGLARLINDAWTSPILGQRAKALIFGIVARGLGCSVARAEADAMLAEAGVARRTSEAALDHLRAPELEETENVLLAFARDTIWYQPAGIQRRARAVRDRLTRPEFVEAVGVCALANALGRLCPAVLES